MSRENSSEDLHLEGLASPTEAQAKAGPSRPKSNRKSSKSVSHAPPPLLSPTITRGMAKRSTSYLDAHRVGEEEAAVPDKLKWRISTPNMAKKQLAPDPYPPPAPSTSTLTTGSRHVESRARSTSTSIVLPNTLPAKEPFLSFTPADLPSPEPPLPPPPSSLLGSIYQLGESSVRRVGGLFGIAGPSTYNVVSLDEESSSGSHTPRTSEESHQDPGYFSLPPTPPPGEEDDDEAERFRRALYSSQRGIASLPTPAASRSLSGRNTAGGHHEGWLGTIALRFASHRGGSGKTAQVLRELGWTVGILIGMFFVSLGVGLYLLKGLPITQLKHLPSSTTDLQLLSAEIRSYMQSSDAGWWHTVGVVTLVGCWKHAWSVPGAVVLNILVGSILAPMPALALLTFITATGSLFSYLLSRPLAPLIAVLFPKPLALVQAALAPESSATDATRTSPQGRIWRRLLIMRAAGFVPWSGMNVACGVVGVDWKIFWLTTAAGSASWSYVTASVGDILSRLQIPPSASVTGIGTEMEVPRGESLTSMLRDPVLLAKLVFLTLITLIPVFLKRKSEAPGEVQEIELDVQGDKPQIILHLDQSSPVVGGSSPTPLSPVTQNLARFTPTPVVFDLLSFGRTAIRAGGGAIMTGLREVRAGAERLSHH